MPPHLFLLSPAYCGGRRATYLLRDGSQLPLAAKLRDGVLTLGEAFAFLSGLYFRGKLAYATAFARPLGTVPGALVITPTRGLMTPDSAIDGAILREFASVDVSEDDARYRAPLERDLDAIRRGLSPDVRVVLLGSIATGKYLDVLSAVLGGRLYYPSAFVGRGDMSRGGLLLRCADSGKELDYAALADGARRHGPRPPKLEPRRPPFIRPFRQG